MSTDALPAIEPRPGQALALINGRLFTARDDLPWVSAVLISDGRIVALGDDDAVRDAAPADALVIDLHGRMGMPGIHDAHTHLLFSGLKFQFECRIRPDSGPSGVIEDLTACQCGGHGLPGTGGWIVGGEINPFNFGEGELDRSFLDAAFPDQPVFLYDYTIHHGFANSTALAAAGVDATTPDPFGGRIVRRDESREPTGELVERGTWPVQRAIPDHAPETYVDAVRWAVRTCNKFGITSVQEASAGRQELAALRTLDDAGELTVKVAAHLVWKEEGFGMASAAELDALLDRASEESSHHVDTRFVKLWLDGAPLPPHFTQSSILADGQVDTSQILIRGEELLPALVRFDGEGRTVKIHCAADGAVRVALDAIEHVRETNGNDGPVHEVAHCGFVDPADLSRFAQLNVVAEMSPAIWHRREPEFRVLDAGFKFNTLQSVGAPMTIGSDWIITPDPNLFPALQGVLERGAESLPVERALQVMTIEGARVVGREQDTGSLEVGKSADVIVLDRDITRVDSSEVGSTEVLLTVFEGQVVFQSNHP